jgi:hypothetical protein
MIVVVLFREDLKYDNMVGTAIPFIYNYAGMFYGNKFVIALKEDADGDRGGECHNKMSVRVMRFDRNGLQSPPQDIPATCI